MSDESWVRLGSRNSSVGMTKCSGNRSVAVVVGRESTDGFKMNIIERRRHWQVVNNIGLLKIVGFRYKFYFNF